MTNIITVETFANMTENGNYIVENQDSWNIHFEMLKANISYDKDCNEISFHPVDGGACLYIDTQIIDEITEDQGNFNIRFNGVMSDLIITKN